MNIRPATTNDMSDVLALIQELATFEKEPDAVEVTIEDLIKDGFGEHPLFNVLVAELDKHIIGMALFYNIHDPHEDRAPGHKQRTVQCQQAAAGGTPAVRRVRQ